MLIAHLSGDSPLVRLTFNIQIDNKGMFLKIYTDFKQSLVVRKRHVELFDDHKI